MSLEMASFDFDATFDVSGPKYWSKIAIFPAPRAFEKTRPIRGSPSEYRLMRKARMAELADGKKFEDMFTLFDIIHERDSQTNRQTPHDGKADKQTDTARRHKPRYA